MRATSSESPYLKLSLLALWGSAAIATAVAASFIPAYLNIFDSEFFDIYILFTSIAVLAIVTVLARYNACHIALLIAVLPLLPYYYRSWGQKWLHTADFALIVLTLGLVLANKSKPDAGRRQTYFAAVILWLLGWTVLGFVGVDFSTTFRGVFRLAPVLIVAVALRASIDLGQTPERLIKAMKFALVVCCLFLLIQICVGVRFTFYETLNPNVGAGAAGGVRYPGPMYDPQAFGQLLCVLTLFCMQDALRSRSFVSLLLGLLGIVSLVFTGSRAPMLAFLVGLVIISIYERAVLKTVGLALLGPAAVVLTVSILPGMPVLRILDTGSDAQVRAGIWQRSMPLFRAYPIAGIGWDNYSKVVLRYDPDAYWMTPQGPVVFDQPESTYVKILLETGILGALVFLAALFASLRRYRACLKSLALYSAPTQQFLVSSFAALVALMISFATVYTLDDHRILMLFSLFLVTPYFYSPLPGKRAGFSALIRSQ